MALRLLLRYGIDKHNANMKVWDEVHLVSMFLYV